MIADMHMIPDDAADISKYVFEKIPGREKGSLS